MKLKLHHPLWTHLPAAGCVVASAVLLLNTRLPQRVPVHFGLDGHPNRWGAPVEHWLVMIGLPVLFLIGSVWLDELYARHEQHHRFNWFSLFDEMIIGFFLGMNITLVPQLSAPNPVFRGWSPWALLFGGVATALAALLELRRPHQPMARIEPLVDVAARAAEVQSQFKPGAHWLYWETQDSIWMRLVVFVTVFFMAALTVAVVVARQSFWLLPILAVVTLLTVAFYGGFRVALTPGRLMVRLGIIGLPVLRLKLVNVTAVEVVNFSPLGEFGGWGIRYSPSRCAWAFFVAGNRGVMMHTQKGKNYLIGSDTPEKLAAAVEAARRA